MSRYIYTFLFFIPLLPFVQAQEATHVIPDAIVQKVSPSVVAIQHRRAGGSGFIISTDGYILSNGHVVTRNDPEFPTEAEESITVILDDERKYSATVIGFSMDPDVSLLKIEPDEPLKPVEFADSKTVTTGQKCFAVGTPVGLKRTFTSGILSNVDRADLGTFTKVLQTDAAINSGNSGGPLFDENGRVLGINTYARRGANNLGFTIPAHIALEMKDQFMKHGRFVRSGLWYCVLGEIYDELAETLEVDGGILVHHVEPGTPVDEAGLRTGDVIVTIDGKPCPTRTYAKFLDWNWDLSTREPGSSIKASILRGSGQSQTALTLPLPLAEFKNIPPRGMQAGNLKTYSYRPLGLGYQKIVFLMRIYASLTDDKGVIVASVDDNSVAKDAGIRKYDIITHVAGQAVSDVDSFERILEAQLAEKQPVIPVTVQQRRHTSRTALAPRYELGGKNAVLLIPTDDFEYLDMLRRELLVDGANISIHVLDSGIFKAEDIDTDAIDILVLCGHDTPSELSTNEEVFKVIKAAREGGSVLAAIGASSLALPKADKALLKKRITTSSQAASAALELGATYTGKDVEEDDKIVTTTGRTRRVVRTFLQKLRETAR